MEEPCSSLPYRTGRAKVRLEAGVFGLLVLCLEIAAALYGVANSKSDKEWAYLQHAKLIRMFINSMRKLHGKDLHIQC